jgi:hypothetical protein
MADMLLLQIAVSADLFHTATGLAYADLLSNGKRETCPIRSERFRWWLRSGYYDATGRAPSAGAIRSTLDLLEARAQFDGPELAVNVRVAQQAGRIYLDLADERWRAVEIGPDGWRVVGHPPVRFRRPAGLLAIPAPQRGGSIDLLAPFVNLPTENDFVLVIMWLLATLRSGGPYPPLVISGEQGSAKTALAKFLKALVDPNAAPARALPREDRELFIAANNGHVLAFDNLSSLPSGLSDTLCRVASGGSFAVRQLYTNQDEVLFDAARPMILNGIEDFVSRPDLGDRAIFLALAPITDANRRPEPALWRDFEIARPRILGTLLDAATHGLRMLPQVHLERLPRMADFMLWATACETALWPAGTFARAYAENRRAAVDRVIDADPVADAVRTIMSNRSAWAGTASDLMRAAANLSDDDMVARTAGWPRTPRVLAGRVRRAQTFLRTLGIEIAFSREGHAGARMITISAAQEPAETSSGPSAASATVSPSRCKYRRKRACRTSVADDADAKTT